MEKIMDWLRDEVSMWHERVFTNDWILYTIQWIRVYLQLSENVAYIVVLLFRREGTSL